MSAVIQSVFSETEAHMKKTIDRLHVDFSAVRTGRASTSILDPIKVDFYGSMVPIQQVGNMAVTEGRTIEIRPWDVAVLPNLEKAILNANLGLTPQNDGKVMRLTFPALTGDRRKDLVKVVKKLAEDFRVSLRNNRRDAIEKLKKFEKDKILSQDELKNNENKIQGLTDSYIKKVDEILTAKEKEILEV